MKIIKFSRESLIESTCSRLHNYNDWCNWHSLNVPHLAKERGTDGKKIYTAFRSPSKLLRGGTSANPSSPLSLSSPVGGDDDKSSWDVATHNQIRPSPVTPPPAPTLDWLFPAPPPTTPDILRGRDSAENTTHVLDVPHTVHPSHPFAPRVSRKPTSGYHPLPLPSCCLP